MIFAERGPWLFGRTVDLAVFGGSALASLALVAIGAATGVLESDAPDWLWITAVVAVDVAHVWSTLFRAYASGAEVRRRPWLYLGTPLACWIAGVAVHAIDPALFWRALAYAAVFHFVRQQYGWVALYRRRLGERRGIDQWIDTTAIYAATVYPLIHWHASLPTRIAWFVDGDFVPGLPAIVAEGLAPLYWAILVVFLARQWVRWRTERFVSPGKILVVTTTWLCWWLGIVALDGDFAFTATNVLIHGVPYFALTYRYGRAVRGLNPTSTPKARIVLFSLAFVGTVIGLASLEEALWDRYVWHEREWLFGPGASLAERLLDLLVPLLAVPQATHYALDAFVWRRRGNPQLADHAPPQPTPRDLARAA